MPDPIEIVGLRDFRRDLRKLDSRLPKYVGKAHRAIAKEVGLAARSAVATSAYPGLRRHAARGVRWSGKQTEAAIRLKAGTGAIAQERGTKYHWVFGRRVRASSMRRRVFPPWVGNKWEGGAFGSFGSGGHFAAVTVERHLPTIEDHYLDYVIDALREAFPD